MKRLINILVCALLMASFAEAQTVTDDLVGLGMHPELAEFIATRIPGGVNLDNNAFFKSTDAAGTGTLSMLKGDATDDTVLNADSGDMIKLSVANTPVAAVGAPAVVAAFTPLASADLFVGGKVIQTDEQVFAAAKGEVYGVAAMTPATNFTPVAASSIASRVSRLVSGSPTLAAVHLPAATASVGKRYEITNEGTNPIVICPINATDTINATAAKTPFSVAAGKIGDCLGVATGKFQCGAK